MYEIILVRALNWQASTLLKLAIMSDQLVNLLERLISYVLRAYISCRCTLLAISQLCPQGSLLTFYALISNTSNNSGVTLSCYDEYMRKVMRFGGLCPIPVTVCILCMNWSETGFLFRGLNSSPSMIIKLVKSC